MSKNQINRPPLGLRPKWAAQLERYYEVCDAISRSYNAGNKIPLEWIEEYNELIQLNEMNNLPPLNPNESEQTILPDFNIAKELTYGEKVSTLKRNIGMFITHSDYIHNNIEFNDVYKLLIHKNMYVAESLIIRYNNHVHSFINKERDDYKHGKYEPLTIDEIQKYLDDNYIVIIYSFIDKEYNPTDKHKFSTIIFEQ